MKSERDHSGSGCQLLQPRLLGVSEVRIRQVNIGVQHIHIVASHQVKYFRAAGPDPEPGPPGGGSAEEGTLARVSSGDPLLEPLPRKF